MSAPYEIMAAPFTAWLGTAGMVEPTNLSADTELAAASKVGANGSRNYDEDGVSVTHEQNIESFRGLGGTGPAKVWRTEELVTIEFTVYDVTPEQYAKALNGVTPTTVAAGAATSAAKTLALLLGQDVAIHSLILRSDRGGPYGDGVDKRAQYWCPYVWQDESPEVVHKKGEPAGLKLAFKTLEDVAAGFGKYRAASAAPTP